MNECILTLITSAIGETIQKQKGIVASQIETVLNEVPRFIREPIEPEKNEITEVDEEPSLSREAGAAGAATKGKTVNQNTIGTPGGDKDTSTPIPQVQNLKTMAQKAKDGS